MLVARLGLRSVEVARLELGDIDWRAGEIVIAGKARRRDRLPLPHDVGQALSAYLRDVRPATSIRAVFLMLKAPIRPIRADLVGDDTGWACHQAGLPEVGPHRPRHALATTAVCAKVDLEASLMIVGVGLALTSQEARDDNTLLTLVGASPRVRRSLAAARAGVLTLLGAAVAVPAGLLPIWGFVGSLSKWRGHRPRSGRSGSLERGRRGPGPGRRRRCRLGGHQARSSGRRPPAGEDVAAGTREVWFAGQLGPAYGS
jgi:hypothetical protein